MEEEFYSSISRVKKADAVQHSLTKWTGLLPENLEKHKVEVVRVDLQDEKGNKFYIDGDSCALCKFYWESGLQDPFNCERCPIYTVSGRECFSEFTTYEHTYNPKPMINLLEEVKQKIASEQKPK